MSETTPAVTWTHDLATTVELVRTLHDLPWAADRSAVERLVAERPGWKIRREMNDLLAVGMFPTGGTELYFDATAPKQAHYRRVRLMRLLDFAPTATPHQRQAALRQLAEALGAVGTPTPAPTGAEGFGLLWRSGERVMLLQSNDRWAWVSLHQAVAGAQHVDEDVLGRISKDLPPLWDSGERDQRLTLHRFAEPPALERRRDVFADVYRAVCGVLGDPTLYGGGPDGPDVRWRGSGEDTTLLRLRADRREVWVETASAEAVEAEELGTFRWGGPGSDGSSDFSRLPYSWQLHLYGPGETAVYLPGGRLAGNLPHLREALELQFAAWIEQLPVQRPGEKVTFTIASRRISGGISFTYDTDKGFLLRVGPRPGDPQVVAAAMTADGWQPSGKRWKAEFPAPTARTATDVAALIIAELAARGLTGDHGEVTARRVCLGPAWGFFLATGLGLETS
ncbi:hypothetical protein ACFV4F_07580 [Kitasatospora sp. NPDC059722]|uniref:hypothetical protein n=1 Tax=Kitasatospora sp. NPDC059722 TaxID=3346925 RepID=UPI0036939735